MAFHGCFFFFFFFPVFLIIFFVPCNAHGGTGTGTNQQPPAAIKLNVIDRCWRRSPNWQRHRQQLGACSVGFSGKMTNNVGADVVKYKVTDDSDHPLEPKPGTLRFGATAIKGKVWITFKKDMRIKLEKPLLISSFTTIDGRGASVHIAGGGCLLLHQVLLLLFLFLSFYFSGWLSLEPGKY